jgi:predicted permease
MRFTRWFYTIPLRLRSLLRRRQVEQELDEELRYHIERQIEEGIAKGMTPEEARYAAQRVMGGVEQRKEECRDMRRVRLIEDLIQDLRYGLRTLCRSPGFTAVATLTLALGIGANIALFSVVNAVLLRSLPFRDPSRLVILNNNHPEILNNVGVSYLNYKDWKEQNTTFQELAAYSFNSNRDSWKLFLIHNGEPDELTGILISHDLFSLMGARPEYGRSFLPEEERSGYDQVVILSHHLWKRRFASDPGIVGKDIELDNKAFRVVGVMSEQSQFPAEADIWLPLSRLGKELTDRRAHSLEIIGRLKPGVTESQALLEIKAIARRLDEAYPESNQNKGVVQIGLLDHYTGGIRLVLMVLLGAASLVMLIACANVANLLLARAANRKKESAIRAAYGAGRCRIFRQLLTESLLLAGFGTMGGLLIAFGSITLFNRRAAGLTSIPRLDESTIDPTVLIYAVGIAVLTGLLFGTLPALQASHLDLNSALKQGGRNMQGAMQGKLRNLLIISEVAIAVTVLIGTGLLVRSLVHLVRVDPGFRTDNLLTVQLTLPGIKYSDGRKVEAFYRQLLERVRALPGVKGATTISVLHIVPSLALMRFAVEGTPALPLKEYPIAQIRGVLPGYFELMNIPIRRGQSFQDSDLGATTPRGFIINETMARFYFRNEDPIGRKILVGVSSKSPLAIPIIGVAADVRDLGVDKEPQAEIYGPGIGGILLVHTSVDPLSLSSAIQKAVQSVDPYQPIARLRTMQEVIESSVARRKFLVSLMTIFSGLALALSAIGIYGVMSYSVLQRTPEIGIRMALGADRTNIIRLLLRQGMIPVLLGIALGSIGAWSLKKALAGLLYQVSLTDPLTHLGVATVIILTAIIAILVPSRRATKIDPLTALKQE